ncbi:hypothetical protein, partial [Lacticaseibacillus paracasei]
LQVSRFIRSVKHNGFSSTFGWGFCCPWWLAWVQFLPATLRLILERSESYFFVIALERERFLCYFEGAQVPETK